MSSLPLWSTCTRHVSRMFFQIHVLNYTSAAIITQICRNRRRGRRMRPSLFFAIRVVAESGLLYTVAGVALLAGAVVVLLPNGSQLPVIIFGAIVRQTSIDSV